MIGHISRHCLEGLKKITENLGRFPDQDLNPGPPEYEVPTEQRIFAILLKIVPCLK